MYHHSFLFVVVSGNAQIENILRGNAPIEDCDYTFQTVQHIQDAADLCRPDMAVIYDNVGGTELPKQREADEECIFVTGERSSGSGEGNPLLTEQSVVAAVSEMWVMPGQGKYDSALLRVYFKRLVNRMKKRADARKQEICFETLINSVPDVSWFKDTSGAHLIVNDSFCEMVGKTKEQIYKKGHCYIWNASKEDEEVCLNSDQIIMESRKTSAFEENVKTQNDIRLLKSYKSALIDVDGEIFGTCGIAHDVTELKNMSTELDIVLDSVPFAIVVEDIQGVVLNKNSRFDTYFPQFTDIVGKSSDGWRKSLSQKLLLEDRLMEVVVQSGEDNRVLVFKEELIQGTLGKAIGKIVTLTDITLEWNISKQNEHTANTDYLTGLNNRRNLMNELSKIYMGDDVSLIMIDLDNFKQVNDSFGHEAGDRVLIKTAGLMKECFSDSFCARMGGDEFMILAKGKKSDEIMQDTKHLMERLREAFKEQKEFSCVTASIGIVSTVSIPAQHRSVSELLETVDSLLYEAKKRGKDCYCVYDGDRL